MACHTGLVFYLARSARVVTILSPFSHTLSHSYTHTHISLSLAVFAAAVGVAPALSVEAPGETRSPCPAGSTISQAHRRTTSSTSVPALTASPLPHAVSLTAAVRPTCRRLSAYLSCHTVAACPSVLKLEMRDWREHQPILGPIPEPLPESPAEPGPGPEPEPELASSPQKAPAEPEAAPVVSPRVEFATTSPDIPPFKPSRKQQAGCCTSPGRDK